MTTAPALFATTPDGYRLTDTQHGIQFDVARLRRERHELVGELAVSCGMLGAHAVDGVLSIGTFNLSSPRARKERAGHLAERARTNGIDWSSRLEELCQRTIAAERTGRPSILLRDLPRPTPADRLNIEGLQLLRDHPVIWFGDGGTAKSYLGLFAAGNLARRGHTVLFADWELSGDDHRDRLERIFGEDMPPVLYARCERPMVFESDRLARLVHRDEVNFLICDSVAFACDGPPEAAEVASRYFQAVRQIGVGSLHLAHTNRSERADEKPFGSTFWHNGARSTWHVKLAQTSSDGQLISVGLYNKKANLGPLAPAVGFNIAFDHQRTRFVRVDVTSVEELAESLPLWMRVRASVTGQPQTLSALASELGANVESLDRTIRRKKELFTRINGDDGVTRIALLERRTA
jgi:hypothetical protein